jgi:two-component system phosphate regulon sensor histidine kinase PhoR
MWKPWLSPSDEINKVIKRLLGGDLTARVSASNAKSHDGLGENTNRLADRLQYTVNKLSHDSSRLITVLTNMIEAVVAVDLQTHLLIANPAFSKLFGINVPTALGKPLLEVIRHNGLHELTQRVLSDKTEATDLISTWTPDEREFEAHAMPLFENDACVGALIVLHDVTRIRQLEKIRKDFVANVSHELRTPLAAIKGFAETLSSGGIDDEENRLSFVRSIEKQADRMTSLVDDLLDLTAIESGKRAPIKEPTNLTELIDEIIDSLKPLATRKRISLSAQPLSELPLVSCDRKQIKQVLTNLIENAIKFNNETGSVSVNGENNGVSVTISVSDSGPGIPESDLPRIFERFYRVDKARSRELGGTGLGLAIVKHIIEAHGGFVVVESTLGHGATFRFTLPLSA